MFSVIACLILQLLYGHHYASSAAVSCYKLYSYVLNDKNKGVRMSLPLGSKPQKNRSSQNFYVLKISLTHF
ncbi:hypothetical protein RchiOBHm_Chr2g0169741 [Rosa chinensis]|uniref:Secreted protein n=1 Tax=Rosa chinensis TaxID=74649 RepID=A0A2P6S4X1_ROSCH|nr:hypothetical protein RchiOBHm_Chr2g0169741 [Rosa chinensis]